MASDVQINYFLCSMVNFQRNTLPISMIYLIFFFLFVVLVFLKSYYNSFFCFADYKTRDCVPQLVTCYLQNKINIDLLATHRLPFDQIHKAFELYHAGKV